MPELEQELKQLYADAGQQLFHCALAVTVSSDLAEDAVHDAFAKVLRVSQRPENLRAYMFRSVRNAAVDIVRKQSRTVQPNSEQLFDAPIDCETVDHVIDQELFSLALASLPENQREVVLEHLVAGLTFREIAELQERPMGTIVTWYRRAIEKLRSSMSQYHE